MSKFASAKGVVLAGLGKTYEWDTSGFRDGSVQITGTFVATLVAEGSNDGGVTWNTVATYAADAITLLTSVTAPGLYRFLAFGYERMRFRVSAYTSGSPTISAFMKE